MIFALIGNQNCGKTTLFNQLTGSNQHVGNFPGVTVDLKMGTVTGRRDVGLADLPGLYSLSPYTSEEMVSRDFLLDQNPDGIINIADATNIERNLYLTLQLMELQRPMVLALNMMDEVQANGDTIDITRLERELGIPVVPISAIKKQGLDELMARAIDTAEARKAPDETDFYDPAEGPPRPDTKARLGEAVHRAIHAIEQVIAPQTILQKLPTRFVAAKLAEGDELLTARLALNDTQIQAIDDIVREMETATELDREAALADARYRFIERVCAQCVVKTGESREYRRSVRLDAVLTHKIWAMPSFFAIMLLVFWLTFGVIGTPLSEWMSQGVDSVGQALDHVLAGWGTSPVLHSLIIEGILPGVGAVLGFLPIILTLFFCLSILEDSGYMARVAFIMDRPLRKIGLSGRSFVPMLMGFGCTVPAIMATRTLPGERDKKITMILLPFMSCSAKLPIYALFTAAFFPRHQVLVMMSLYMLGIALAVACGFVLRKLNRRAPVTPFLMELPNYRFPSPKTVLLLLWDKAKEFVRRAFTVILLASVVIWLLQSFDLHLAPATDPTNSILAWLGRGMTPIFTPLGFADWRATTALITGFIAKESVISTLAVLTSTGLTELGPALSTLFSPLSAFSFLVFTLLYTPCVAAVWAIRRELRSLRGMLLIVLAQTAMAWLVAFVVYQVGGWFF